MININLKNYENVEFRYHTGTRYVLITKYDYGQTWDLKITGLRIMADAFTVIDDNLRHSIPLIITHRELLQGEVKKFVDNEVNKKFKPELELIPF